MQSRNGSRRHVRLNHPRPAGAIAQVRVKSRHKSPSGVEPRKQHIDPKYQSAVKNFELGVRAFRRHNYSKAAEIFEKLLSSEAREVAERAQVHLRLCKQRTGRPAPTPKSADEYYTVGIACLNARNLPLAVEYLSKADKLRPNQDHIRYALGAAHALQGDIDVAMEHLEAAVSLRSEVRIHARRDEDFLGLASEPRFRRLIFPAGS